MNFPYNSQKICLSQHDICTFLLRVWSSCEIGLDSHPICLASVYCQSALPTTTADEANDITTMEGRPKVLSSDIWSQ